MKSPFALKITIGFAAIALSASLSVRGRLSVQILSCASTAMLETSPIFMVGGTLGQLLSTSKVGRLRCAGAAEAGARAHPPAALTNALKTTPFRKLRFMVPSHCASRSYDELASPALSMRLFTRIGNADRRPR